MDNSCRGVTYLLLTCCNQMARHVFQYERMDEPVGLFAADPSLLPPLDPLPHQLEEGHAFSRPLRADTAGLAWVYDGRHPQARDNTGRAHREEAIRQQQRPQHHVNTLHSVPSAPAQYANNNSNSSNAPVYNRDGSSE